MPSTANGMSNNSPANYDRTVEELLFQQLEVMNSALEKTISLNLEITKRLAERGGPSPASLTDVPESPALLLEFDCGDGSSKAIPFTKPNLGMDIRSNRMPMTLANVKDQALALGCRDGWTLKSIAGINVSAFRFEDAFELLKGKLSELRTKISDPGHQKAPAAATSSLEVPLLSKESGAAKPHVPITGGDIVALQKKFEVVPYSLESMYWQTGCAQALARNFWFQACSMTVISLNCLWIAYDAEYDSSPTLLQAPLYMQVVSNIFCLYFFFEIIVRFLAWQDKCKAFRDKWFVFDLVLVVLMVWETWVVPITMLLAPKDLHHAGHSKFFSIFRIFRLARIARISALIRGAPQLVLLINCMYKAFNSVMSAFTLLWAMVFVFAVTFKLTLGVTTDGMDEAEIAEAQFDNGQFNHIGSAFNYLLAQMMCGPDADMFKTFLDAGFVFYALYMFCVIVGYMTIVNMIIGLLCEIVSGQVNDERIQKFEWELDERIGGLLRQLDTDGSGMITKEEFPALMRNERMLCYLMDLEVDAPGLVDFVNFSLKISGSTGMTIDELLDTIKDFRPGQPATAADIKLLKMSLLQRVDEHHDWHKEIATFGSFGLGHRRQGKWGHHSPR